MIIKSANVNPTAPESVTVNVNVSVDNEAALTEAVLLASNEYPQFEHTAGILFTLRYSWGTLYAVLINSYGNGLYNGLVRLNTLFTV